MRRNSHFEFRDFRNTDVAQSLGAAFAGLPAPGLPGAPPRSSQTALRGPGGPSPAGRPRRAPEGDPPASRGRLRAWGGPRRSGGPRVSLRSPPGRPPGLRRSSRRALRRSRFRCPSGFPFSLPPSLYLHSIDRHPPVSSPSGVSFATFSAPIRHRRLPNGKTKGSSFQLRTRNLPGRNLPVRYITIW